MMYIIMKEKYYQGIENSYDIEDYTDINVHEDNNEKE